MGRKKSLKKSLRELNRLIQELKGSDSNLELRYKTLLEVYGKLFNQDTTSVKDRKKACELLESRINEVLEMKIASKKVQDCLLQIKAIEENRGVFETWLWQKKLGLCDVYDIEDLYIKLLDASDKERRKQLSLDLQKKLDEKFDIESEPNLQKIKATCENLEYLPNLQLLKHELKEHIRELRSTLIYRKEIEEIELALQDIKLNQEESKEIAIQKIEMILQTLELRLGKEKLASLKNSFSLLKENLDNTEFEHKIRKCIEELEAVEKLELAYHDFVDGKYTTKKVCMLNTRTHQDGTQEREFPIVEEVSVNADLYNNFNRYRYHQDKFMPGVKDFIGSVLFGLGGAVMTVGLDLPQGIVSLYTFGFLASVAYKRISNYKQMMEHRENYRLDLRREAGKILDMPEPEREKLLKQCGKYRLEVEKQLTELSDPERKNEKDSSVWQMIKKYFTSSSTDKKIHDLKKELHVNSTDDLDDMQNEQNIIKQNYVLVRAKRYNQYRELENGLNRALQDARKLTKQQREKTRKNRVPKTATNSSAEIPLMNSIRQ